jgi:hypothetical protein
MISEPRRIVMLTNAEIAALLAALDTIPDEQETIALSSAIEKLSAVADREGTDRDLPRAIETLRRDVG